MPAWRDRADRASDSASTGSAAIRYISVRLHVEIATASCTSTARTSSPSSDAARPSGSESRSRRASVAVLCDAPMASSSFIAILSEIRERLDLALDAREAGADDGDVDHQHRHKDAVSREDVLTSLVQRQRGRLREQMQHQRAPTNTRSAPASSRASRRRRRRRRWSLDDFAVSSSLQSVTNSKEIATSETSHVRRIEPGSSPATRVKTLGCTSGGASRTATKLSGTNAPAVIAKTAA